MHSLALFWSKVQVNELDECWEWTAYIAPNGYGRFLCRSDDWSRLAHRWAYYLTRGIRPVGLIRHSCDNRRCCNPTHLSDGTHQDNMDDRELRGRTAMGTKNSRCKLTETQMLEIRSSTLSSSVLASNYHITRQMVWKIRGKKSWCHL